MHISELAETDIPSVYGAVRTFSLHLASRLGVDAEDVCQDAMIKFISKPSGAGRLSCWLWKTVKSVALDAFRKEARDKKYRTTVHNLTEDLQDRADETAVVHVRRVFPCVGHEAEPDEMPMLQKLLANLPLDQRRVLVLVAAGYKYAEIAAITNVSIGTVRSRLHHARKKAQLQLASYQPEPV